MTADLRSERLRAVGRLGLIFVLVGAWVGRGVSPAAGAAALKAAFANAAPAKPGAASVSWLNGGAKLDAAALESLRKEAEVGAAGPAMLAFLESARQREDLNKAVFSSGMTYAQILRRTQDLSDEANSKPLDQGEPEPVETRPLGEEPAVEVRRLIVELQSPHADARAFAAMLLADNRLAKAEQAGEALPALEMFAANKNEQGSEFAALAIKRIRYWEAKRRK